MWIHVIIFPDPLRVKLIIFPWQYNSNSYAYIFHPLAITTSSFEHQYKLGRRFLLS